MDSNPGVDLGALRREPNLAYARLPAPLGELFSRQRSASLLRWRGSGAACAAAGIGLAYYEAAPPLSSEEIQFIAVGIAVALGGVGLVAWSFFVKHGELATFLRDDIVWIYHRTVPRLGHFAMFCAADGTVASVRIDDDYSALDPKARDATYAAMDACHPHAVLGHTPEREAQYQRDPRALT